MAGFWEAVMQAAFHHCFGKAEDVHRPGHTHLTGALAQPGQHRFPEDGQALPGRPRKLHQDLFALLQPDAGGGAVVVYQGFAALGNHGLPPVVVGELPTGGGEVLPDAPLGFRIPHQRNPHLLGGGFPGDVVVGGAQAADGQDQIAPGKGLGQRLADRRWFIAGHRLAMNMYAGFLQSGCNFPGIGIQNIAGEHLIAHRYDLTVQIHSLLLGRRPPLGLYRYRSAD